MLPLNQWEFYNGIIYGTRRGKREKPRCARSKADTGPASPISLSNSNLPSPRVSAESAQHDGPDQIHKISQIFPMTMNIAARVLGGSGKTPEVVLLKGSKELEAYPFEIHHSNDPQRQTSFLLRV